MRRVSRIAALFAALAGCATEDRENCRTLLECEQCTMREGCAFCLETNECLPLESFCNEPVRLPDQCVPEMAAATSATTGK